MLWLALASGTHGKLATPLGGVVENATYIRTHFIKNEGQYPEKVLYASFPTNTFVMKDGIVVKGVKIRFKGVRASVKVKAEDRQVATFSYFKGKDPSRWRRNVPSYGRVIYEGIYEGIDLIFTGLKGGRIEFQWVVKPGADVGKIGFEVECEGCEVKKEGDDVVVMMGGKEVFAISSLRAYQGADEVDVMFRVEGKVIGYKVGEYDKNDVLVIDPDISNLLASTYLGGSGDESPRAIAVDGFGNVYVAGWTWSSDFPVQGAYDETYNGGGDVFVSKLSGDLSTLLASTFLGGSSTVGDYASGIAVDPHGNVYIVGGAISADFPTTPGAYDTTNNGARDVFISKLDGNLSTLLASTFLGGSEWDLASGIAFDTLGNVYITGGTKSNNFPTTSGAYDNTCGGCPDSADAFISKLDGNLTTLLASTFLGGNDDDYAGEFVLDPSGNVYVVGYTESVDFPTTPGVYDPAYNGTRDAFVSRLNGDLSSLISSTLLGGSNDDGASTIILSSSGDLYVAGWTYSSDFPTTSGAYDGTYNGSSDVFISRLDGNLSALIASTFLGGSDREKVPNVVLDSSGNVYFAGWTYSPDFPATPGAYDTTFNDSSDAFVGKLNGGLSVLIASTFLGGSDNDGAYAISLDTARNIYVVGGTGSSDFPTTPGAYDETFNGGSSDVFIGRFGVGDQVSVSEIPKSSHLNFTLYKNAITFKIEEPTYLGLNVYDFSGRLIKRITYGFVQAGVYKLNLNDIPKGAYTVKVRIGDKIKEVKILR